MTIPSGRINCFLLRCRILFSTNNTGSLLSTSCTISCSLHLDCVRWRLVTLIINRNILVTCARGTSHITRGLSGYG